MVEGRGLEPHPHLAVAGFRQRAFAVGDLVDSPVFFKIERPISFLLWTAL